MTYKDSTVLLAGQVDNFALACIDNDTACGITTHIGKHIHLPSDAVIPIAFQGIITSYNRCDVLQTTDYIKISSESYLQRVLKSHAWEMPSKCESLLTSMPRSPLSDDKAKLLCSVAPGPKEGTKEHVALARTVGYGYCNLWGYGASSPGPSPGR